MCVDRFILNFPVLFLGENCFFPFHKEVTLRASLVYIDKNEYILVLFHAFTVQWRFEICV